MKKIIYLTLSILIFISITSCSSFSPEPKISEYLNSYSLEDLKIINIEKVSPPIGKLEGDYYESTCTFNKETMLGSVQFRMVRTFKFGEDNEIKESRFDKLEMNVMGRWTEYYQDPISPNFH